MRLAHKNFVLVALLFSVITAGTMAVSIEALSRHLTDEYEIKGTAIANSIAHSSVEILLNRDLSTVQSLVDQSLETEGVAYVFVRDAEGEVIAHTFVPAVPREVLELEGRPDGTAIHSLDVPRLGPCLDISAPILAGVAGTVHVGMDLGLIRAKIHQAVVRMLLLMSLVLLASVLGSSIAIRSISRPLGLLADHARGLAGRDFAGQQQQEIRDLAASRDEVGELAGAFVHMEDMLGVYIGNLKETTAAKERIERELSIAREIQMSLVPKIFPPFFNRPELDLYAVIQPAREVGGDLYDFFFLDEHHLFMLVGDVSGKGVPAALFMAVTKTLFKATATRGLSIAEVMTRVNRELCEDNDSGMFVTAFCALLDTRTGSMEYSNGGHNLPYVVHPEAGGLSVVPRTGGMGLGVMEDVEFQTGNLELAPGDALFLYTDGVVEAMDRHRNLYSNRRLEELLADLGTDDPRPIIERVLESVEEFSSGAEQSDDITLLVMTYVGHEERAARARPRRLELRLANDLGELDRLAERLEAFAEQAGVSPKELFRLNLAIEELFTNIVHHAYRDEHRHEIELHVSVEDGRLELMVRDDGVPFNPFEEAAVPDVEAGAEDREVGGLGVHLVKSMFTELHYRRDGEENVLVVSKALQ
ncbi:MAG: SpoIIE family protein phosphatase [Armatimonadetes bacterium]|nr:SpoIIE family protein phosphatase [Armatimonadota bacterium]